MKSMGEKDKCEKREEKKKTQYNEHNWEKFYITGGLDKLMGLNKYLDDLHIHCR